MKVKIGPYKNWFGPYQLAELLCFWVRDVPDEYGFPRKPEWVHKFGEWLAHGSIEPDAKVGEVFKLGCNRPTTALYKFLVWVDRRRKRTVKITIDSYDTWSMDSTLALIVVPMLRQLKDTKHGAPHVDDDDVPVHLRSTTAPPLSQDQIDCGHTDDNYFARWDWVLDEMIWAFEQKTNDNAEDQYYSGTPDFQFKKLDNGMSEMVDGPNHTLKVDRDGLKKHHERMQNGFRLFGKYYSGLWD